MTTNFDQTDTEILPATTLVEEQTRILFNSIPLSLGISAVLALILSVSEWNIIGHGELIIWNTLMLCVIFLRSISWYLWRNALSNFSAAYWLNIFRVGVCTGGLVWGSAVFFMFATLNPTYQALLTFIIAGVACGSLTTLAIDKYSAIGFVGLSILPLSIQLLIDRGPTAIPTSIMSVLYMLFVISAAMRARQNLEDQLYKNLRLIHWGNERAKQQQLGKAINNAQAEFIKSGDVTRVFENLLSDILAIAESEFGFIGEVLYDEQHQPSLKMHTFHLGKNHPHAEKFIDEFAPKDMLFTNMNGLFGAAITKEKPIISNDLNKDMRATGHIPPGHPSIKNFLGIPIASGKKPIALLGIANKAGGYDENILELLQPLIHSIAQFIDALRHERQHKLDEEKLIHNAKRTQAILDEICDGIVSIDKYGIIESFNHAAETIFGYRANEIIGKNINLLMPEPHHSLHDGYIKNYQKTGFGQIIGIGRELTGLRKNGKEFPMELSISEITHATAPIYIGAVRDISERKHTEALKNQFIATVSHELRTPLTSIAGSLSVINSGSLGDLPDNIKKMVMIAYHNSLRLQTLINDLLDMDKLASNKLELKIERVSVDQLIKESIEMNQAYADRYQVTVKLTSFNTNLMIAADSYRAQQVLANLLSNAAKFSNPHSTVNISINIRDHFVRISVTDYGEGIPNDFKAKIFERFTQADSSDTRKKGGSGLGLAISKELIERMGGNIGFTSSTGQGSCFYFELPLTNKS